jgi:uncharacterized membrane protein YccC
MATMPIWVWALIAVAVVALLAVAGYFIWRWWWYRYSRRYLVRLIGKQESLAASRRTLEAILRHLADEPEEALLEFAANEDSVDRKALDEEYQRCVLLEDELRTIPMPKRLIPTADALADVAEVLARESGRFADGRSDDEVLEALSALDLDAVTARFDEADEMMKDALEYYDVDDTAVYGGGLYI